MNHTPAVDFGKHTKKQQLHVSSAIEHLKQGNIEKMRAHIERAVEFGIRGEYENLIAKVTSQYKSSTLKDLGLDRKFMSREDRANVSALLQQRLSPKKFKEEISELHLPPYKHRSPGSTSRSTGAITWQDLRSRIHKQFPNATLEDLRLEATFANSKQRKALLEALNANMTQQKFTELVKSLKRGDFGDDLKIPPFVATRHCPYGSKCYRIKKKLHRRKYLPLVEAPHQRDSTSSESMPDISRLTINDWSREKREGKGLVTLFKNLRKHHERIELYKRICSKFAGGQNLNTWLGECFEHEGLDATTNNRIVKEMYTVDLPGLARDGRNRPSNKLLQISVYKDTLGYDLNAFRGLSSFPVFVNFANDTLGGGVKHEGPGGFVQEELWTFMSNLFIALFSGLSVRGLAKHPRMYRTKQLFQIKGGTNPNKQPYYGYEGFQRLAKDFHEEKYRNTPEGPRLQESPVEQAAHVPQNGHYDWLCMAAIQINKTKIPNQNTIRLYLEQMLETAVKAFSLAALRCADSNVYIATGNWGSGAFNHDAPTIAELQIVAATMASQIVNQIVKKRICLCYYPFGNTDVEDVLNDAGTCLGEWKENRSDCMERWAKQTHQRVLSRAAQDSMRRR